MITSIKSHVVVVVVVLCAELHCSHGSVVTFVLNIVKKPKGNINTHI